MDEPKNTEYLDHDKEKVSDVESVNEEASEEEYIQEGDGNDLETNQEEDGDEDEDKEEQEGEQEGEDDNEEEDEEEQEGEDDNEEEDEEEQEGEEHNQEDQYNKEEHEHSHKKSKSKKIIQQLESILTSPNIISTDQDKHDSEYEESDDEYEDYLEKFDNDIRKDHILKYHNDILQSNYDEISALIKVIRDEQGNIIDPLHNTIPILTKFERARVLGLRAKQINSGAEPFIQVPENVIEGYIIAEMELNEKVIPFIITRPLPNGKKEYWRLKDLEIIDY
jgi:DNA-directed RNA polymerase subunit K/omega